MGLKERLDAAREERRRAAGLPPTPPPDRSGSPVASVPTTTDDHGIDLSSVVDLRQSASVIDLRPVPEPTRPRPTVASPSAPSFTDALAVSERTTCPSCGGEGRLDMEDVVGGVDHYSCTFCGNLFQVAR